MATGVSGPLSACIDCAAEFSAAPNKIRCDKCQKLHVIETAVRRATEAGAWVHQCKCQQCGAEFSGGPRSRFCPNCRVLRKREQVSEWYHATKTTGVERPGRSVYYDVLSDPSDNLGRTIRRDVFTDMMKNGYLSPGTRVRTPIGVYVVTKKRGLEKANESGAK